MEVAVAEMPEHDRAHAGQRGLHPGIGQRHERAQGRRRHRDVVFRRHPLPDEGLGHAFADPPEGLGLRAVLRQRAVQHEARLDRARQDLLQAPDQGRLVVGVGQFHQDGGGRQSVERQARARHVLEDQRERVAGHELECREAVAAPGSHDGEKGERRIDVLHRHEGGRAGARRRKQLQHRAGDDAEGAFRADEQVAQRVAGVVLAQAVNPSHTRPSDRTTSSPSVNSRIVP